jgi:hypothetical protein
MRALLLCPKSATEAADRGLAADEIMNAFITEIDIDSNPRDPQCDMPMLQDQRSSGS